MQAVKKKNSCLMLTAGRHVLEIGVVLERETEPPAAARFFSATSLLQETLNLISKQIRFDLALISREDRAETSFS